MDNLDGLKLDLMRVRAAARLATKALENLEGLMSLNIDHVVLPIKLYSATFELETVAKILTKTLEVKNGRKVS